MAEPQARPAPLTDRDLNAATLDELLDRARETFQVHFEPVTVDGVAFDVLQISNMTEYVDALAAQAGESELTLPFWAKLWPAAILLGYYVKRFPGEPGPTLELGAGVGMAGLVAAAMGRPTTISDMEPDALLFARINILKNNLQDLATVRRIDFTQPPAEDVGPYDLILGAETLYQDDAYRPLVKFLAKALAPRNDAECVLSMSYTRKAKGFFSRAEKEFHIQQQVMGFKAQADAEASPEDQERFLCALYRLRHKKLAARED